MLFLSADRMKLRVPTGNVKLALCRSVGILSQAVRWCQQKQERRMVGGPFAASAGGVSDRSLNKFILACPPRFDEITKVLVHENEG